MPIVIYIVYDYTECEAIDEFEDMNEAVECMHLTQKNRPGDKIDIMVSES